MISHKTRRMVGVVFLTLLIWAWAYFALEERTIVRGALNISQETAQDLLVTFSDTSELSIPVMVTLKGPNSKIAEFKRHLQGDSSDGKKISLDFYYDPHEEKQTEPGTYLWNVLASLRESDQIKGLGLTVEDCDKKNVEVKVEKLIEKQLTVRCVDETGITIKHESIDPPTVAMFVLQGWDGPASVVLAAREVEQARGPDASIQKKPFVTRGPKRIYAETAVTVKLPAKEKALAPKVIQTTRIGYVFDKNIADKYKVELLNEDYLTSSTKLLATDEALAEYEQQRIHLRIEILDSDVRQSIETGTGLITVKVIYNFPEEYVRKNEIQLNESPREAEIKITPITAAPDSQ